MNDPPLAMYRYFDGSQQYDRFGFDLDEKVSYHKPTCVTYYVRRETPCGVWIWDLYKSKERWVSLTTRIAYAYDTKEKALKSYLIKKRKRVYWCEDNLEHAKAILESAEEFNKNVQD